MNDSDIDFVIDYCRREMMQPVFARAEAAAADIRTGLGDSVLAVIFYGSCLRLGNDDDKVLDFYVIVDRYRTAYRSIGLALSNRLLPPNVFYAEVAAGNAVVRSKYAVLSARDFDRRTTNHTLEQLIWARFAQPVALAYARDDSARQLVARALANALIATAGATAPLLPEPFTAGQLWERAFGESYRAELRSEVAGKAGELYRFYAGRYNTLTGAVLRAAGLDVGDHRTEAGATLFDVAISPSRRLGARAGWLARRVLGKTLAIPRLIKAAFTFDGGISYLAWKISRHSGVEITLTAWQKRHPVLAGLGMFWRLRRKGAFR